MNPHRTLLVLLVLAVSCSSITAPVIRLRTAQVSASTSYTAARRAQSFAAGSEQQLIVTVDRRSFSADAFKAAFGAQAVGPHIPPHSFVFVGAAEQEVQLWQQDGVVAVTPMQSIHNVAPQLLRALPAAIPTTSMFNLSALVWLGATNTSVALRALLRTHGMNGHVQLVSERKLELSVPSVVAQLAVSLTASLPHVIWVELQRRFKVRDIFATSVLASDIDPSVDLGAYGLNGSGQVIGCGDTGLDTSLCAFADGSGRAVPTGYLNGSLVVDHEHRKIVSYDPYVGELRPHWVPTAARMPP